MSTVISLADVRAGRNAAAVATSVLQELVQIQDRLIGYFRVEAGNPASDIELGAAGLLFALAERLELAARTLQCPLGLEDTL
jgi:hypothetical protein